MATVRAGCGRVVDPQEFQLVLRANFVGRRAGKAGRDPYHIVQAACATNWCIRATAYGALELSYDLTWLSYPGRKNATAKAHELVFACEPIESVTS
jgi:hypothetical protein